MMDSYQLHKAAFDGNLKELHKLLRDGHDVTEKDKHGNTALHLAVMCGHKDCVHLLLSHNAPIKSKNSLGWNVLAEAISYGDRGILSSVVKALKKQSLSLLDERRPHMVEALAKLNDFYIELKWDFCSWIPLLSRILPSDICKIYKRGTSIRMDSTLMDFSESMWKRGDITFLYDGSKPRGQALLALDNKEKVYQKVQTQNENETKHEEDVDLLMSNDNLSIQLNTESVLFSRTQAGWVFRRDKHEKVGSFEADYYTINGLVLESKKRREHLSEDDLKKNKQTVDQLTKGKMSEEDISGSFQVTHRESLKPPPCPDVSWNDYQNSPKGAPPTLGRPLQSKENKKSYKATLAMSEDFPMAIQELLDILEIIAPYKHFRRLREFISTNLPSGFPVKIEIPVFPTITAKITCQAFEWRPDLEDDLFCVPFYYREDGKHFKNL